MSLLKVRTNAYGTMADVWKIGKSGPTFLHGELEPDDGDGTDGDTYIQTGPTPRLWTKTSGVWLPSGDSSFAFSRQTVTTATAIIGAKVNYVGVNRSAGANLSLASGTAGKRVIIKDESGNASNSAIVIEGVNGDLIDGQSSYAITMNHGFVDLIFNSVGWRIIGRSARSIPLLRQSDVVVVQNAATTTYQFQSNGGNLALSPDFLMVFVNRTALRRSEYTLGEGGVTFLVPLAVGDELEVTTVIPG